MYLIESVRNHRAVCFSSYELPAGRSAAVDAEPPLLWWAVRDLLLGKWGSSCSSANKPLGDDIPNRRQMLSFPVSVPF